MDYYLGWDVGAWHCNATGDSSKDAFCVMNSVGKVLGACEGNFSSVVMSSGRGAKRAWGFIEAIFLECMGDKGIRPCSGDRFMVAIDTPLGWPKAFRRILNLLSRAEGEASEMTDEGGDEGLPHFELGAKIKNPLLHRKTEESIGHAMSAVQDQIGSQSTKAMFLLGALGAERAGTGVWSVPDSQLTLIETYPAPCMRSLNFIERMKSVGVTESIKSIDIFDAIVCATLAREYSSPVHREMLQLPHVGIDVEEGWIFVPKDHLDESSAISYGRLIEKYRETFSFDDLLTCMQVGGIQETLLKPAMKRGTRNQELVATFLRSNLSWDRIIQRARPEFLRELFVVLHPKTKPDNTPSDNEFARISQQLRQQQDTVGAK